MVKAQKVFFTIIVLFSLATACDWGKQKDLESPTLRIGWQTAWATQAQLALVLQKTEILHDKKIEAKFFPFNYGAPMAEAAIAGKLDLAFVGDQPAVSLMARSDDWAVLARLMDFRVAIMVPPESTLKSPRDLEGKVLGIPVGSSTHREALEAIRNAGADPNKVNVVNLDIIEQGEVVRSGSDWGNFDAFASWDPHIAQYKRNEYARTLATSKALGVVMIRKSFAQKHPEIAKSFLVAFREAYWFYVQNENAANKWFMDTTSGKLDAGLLKEVARFEPNFSVSSMEEIKIGLAEEHLLTLQKAADFALDLELIKKRVNIKERVFGVG